MRGEGGEACGAAPHVGSERARARTRVSWLGVCREVADAHSTRARRRAPRSDTRISRETVDVVRHRRNDEIGGRDDAFESASRGRTSDSSAGSGFSSSTPAAASVVSVMARSAEPRRSARIATPSKAPMETLRETDEVVRAGVATRAAAGRRARRACAAAGARHKTLVAVTDAMVRCGLRASRAERLWRGGGRARWSGSARN